MTTEEKQTTMSEEDPIVAEFIVESREHLADIENQLLAIESAGANIDVDLVNTVFRGVHSIKGAAGFLDFSVLGNLAHSLENVLNLVRNLELVPDSTITNVMLRAADALRGMIDDIHHSNDVDASAHIAELQKIADGVAKDSEVETELPAAANSPPPTSELIDETAATDTTASVSAETQPELASPTPEPTAIPTPQTPPEVTTPANSDQPRQKKSGAVGSVTSSAPADTNIRVSVRLLDSLMNLAGELVLSRNQLVQQVGSDSTTQLDSVAARVDQVTSELQEAIMQTRMQVIGTVFGKFPRVVRDLSSQLDKQCQLTIEGEDVELDKSIIEAIGDPLTHLIRNSVDHGIESPEQRVTAGKSATGTIVLRAFHQAGKVNISISDDGAGIDTARLKEKAISRGLITPETARDMSEREVLRLIFHPGFSMAENVTGVSGRGVGMDVVKTNIEKLGGAVGVDTQMGVGTTINVKLPLTLAIIPSLIVRCRDNRFAIPQASISELVRVKATDVAEKIERVQNAEVFRLRGNLLPLVRLDRALDLHEKTDDENGPINIIVVETGHLRYGLVVDGLHDSEEIVVKPLGRHMQDCHCLAGATILGDGRVALILDVAGIASRLELALPDEDDPDVADNSFDGSTNETQTVLLFTNDPTEQFGIPMAVIARIERVRTDQIDSVGGQEVLQYRGVSLPLLCLENYIQARPRPDTKKIYVVVFTVHGSEIGLIVPALTDIRDVPTNVDTTTFSEPGVIGSVEFDGRALRLLDPYRLTQVARLDLSAGSEAIESHHMRNTLHDADDGPAPTILLAEDSAFFRKQVAGQLEEAGHEVIGCEDGLIAWNILRERGEEIDLVVTDVEMPNMDGCQLARHIKDDATLAHLPVIALTSLASEKDVQRGMESGIDDYQVKLDRERLTAAVEKYLRETKKPIGPAGEFAVAAGVGSQS